MGTLFVKVTGWDKNFPRIVVKLPVNLYFTHEPMRLFALFHTQNTAAFMSALATYNSTVSSMVRIFKCPRI